EALETLELDGLLRRPIIPESVSHNAHIYYVLLADLNERTRVLDRLRRAGVSAVFHYVPLHSSLAGQRYGRRHGSLAVTDDASDRLLRLPLWNGMPTAVTLQVVSELEKALTRTKATHL